MPGMRVWAWNPWTVVQRFCAARRSHRDTPLGCDDPARRHRLAQAPLTLGIPSSGSAREQRLFRTAASRIAASRCHRLHERANSMAAVPTAIRHWPASAVAFSDKAIARRVVLALVLALTCFSVGSLLPLVPNAPTTTSSPTISKRTTSPALRMERSIRARTLPVPPTA